jgi:dienelactone hydrolase
MRTIAALVAIATATLTLTGPATAGPSAAAQFQATVGAILAEPYQPAYVPLGYDSAFGAAAVLNTAPVQDYTTGSIPGSPDAPAWPPIFKPVLLNSLDGAPLLGQLALQPGKRPGIVVVHGFNTHGNLSVIRWAAMLAANGYHVLAADQRDFNFEYSAGYGYPEWLQTFGWKEAEDVLAMGRFLAAQPGVTSVGVVGFSLGAQDTVLALALDGAQPRSRAVFSAGLQFSGPADQNTQIYSTAQPPACQTPACTYPATDALITLVVPPYTYTDVCKVLDDAAAHYGTTPYAILTHESAYRAQQHVRVPLLGFYAADDPLVQAFQATMMAGYQAGNPLQRTLELARGAHAYFYDRWWQQRAILLYFKALLPGAARDSAIGTTPTVNRTPGGEPARDQLVDFGSPTPSYADAQAAPYVCDTSLPPPAYAAP